MIDTLNHPGWPNVVTGNDLIARARATDPATSHAAANSVEALRPKQKAVLTIFQSQSPSLGLTDEEMIALYHYHNGNSRCDYPRQSESGLRTRRSELVARGLIEATSFRRKTKSGRDSIAWRAV